MGRKRNVALNDREWLKARIDAGKSQRQIAAEAGCSKGSIGYYVQMHGLQTGLDRPERTKRALKRSYPNGRRGPLAANWRGGRRMTGSGYVRIWKPDHPAADRLGCVYEHRLVMEAKLGRYLKPGEVVDHIDRNRSNNAPENLQLYPTSGSHIREHFTARNQVLKLKAELDRYKARYGELKD